MSVPMNTVGIVGNHDAVALLRAAGFGVVTGDTFGEAATAVTTALRTGALEAVLVFDSEQAPLGTQLWARTTAGKAPMAIIRSGAPSANLPVQGIAHEVQLPERLSEVLVRLGVEPGAASRVDGGLPGNATGAEHITDGTTNLHAPSGPEVHGSSGHRSGPAPSLPGTPVPNVAPVPESATEADPLIWQEMRAAGRNGAVSMAGPAPEREADRIPPTAAAAVADVWDEVRSAPAPADSAVADVWEGIEPAVPAPAAPAPAPVPDDAWEDSSPSPAAAPAVIPSPVHQAAADPWDQPVPVQPTLPVSSDAFQDGPDPMPIHQELPVSAPTPEPAYQATPSQIAPGYEPAHQGGVPHAAEPQYEVPQQFAPAAGYADQVQQRPPELEVPQQSPMGGYTGQQQQQQQQQHEAPQQFAPMGGYADQAHQAPFHQQSAQEPVSTYGQPAPAVEYGWPGRQAEPAGTYQATPTPTHSTAQQASSYPEQAAGDPHVEQGLHQGFAAAPGPQYGYGQAPVQVGYSAQQTQPEPVAPQVRQQYGYDQHGGQQGGYAPVPQTPANMGYEQNQPGYAQYGYGQAPVQPVPEQSPVQAQDYSQGQRGYASQPYGAEAGQSFPAAAPVQEQYGYGQAYPQPGQVPQPIQSQPWPGQSEPDPWAVQPTPVSGYDQQQQQQQQHEPVEAGYQPEQTAYGTYGGYGAEPPAAEAPSPAPATPSWQATQAPSTQYASGQQRAPSASSAPSAAQPSYGHQETPDRYGHPAQGWPGAGDQRQAPADDVMDAFGGTRARPTRRAQQAPSRTPRGKLVVPMAAKGGVGKSSVALGLAQRAAEHGPDGYRVVLIDANRGQGDLRTYLRLAAGALPTIYDAAVSGDPADALVTPERINAARPDGFGEVGFAFVAAPPAECADPSMVSADVYRDVIDYALSRADLVVVDTQIAEAFDTSDIFDKVLVPALGAGGWAMGVSDLSTPGVTNLIARLALFAERGVPADRVLLTLNKMTQADASSQERLAEHLSQAGTYLGAVNLDPKLAADMNIGRIIANNETISPVMDAALKHITGLPDFSAAGSGSSASSAGERPRRGLLGRFRK